MYTKDFIDSVVRKYLLGAALYDICTVFQADMKNVEDVIDIFLRSEGVL